MAGPRIPDDVRAAVLAAVREERPTRAVAAEFGISQASVLRIARLAGVDMTRPNTQNATRAISADFARRRAQIAAELLDDVIRLKAQLFAPATVAMSRTLPDGGGTEIIDHPLDRPTFKDQQAIMTSVAIGLDKHLALVRHEDPNQQAGISLIEAVGRSIRTAFGGNGDDLVTDD